MSHRIYSSSRGEICVDELSPIAQALKNRGDDTSPIAQASKTCADELSPIAQAFKTRADELPSYLVYLKPGVHVQLM